MLPFISFSLSPLKIFDAREKLSWPLTVGKRTKEERNVFRTTSHAIVYENVRNPKNRVMQRQQKKQFALYFLLLI